MRAKPFFVGCWVAVLACTTGSQARASAVTITSNPILDFNQMGNPGYLTTRDLIIHSVEPGSVGPTMDATFNKLYAKVGIEYSVPQNWTGTDMYMFTIQNQENRTVRLAFAAGLNTNINDFTGGFACTAELPPLSTKRYAIVMRVASPDTYRLKRLPLPYDGEFTQVASFNGVPVQNDRILHWRFSLQDPTPSRLKISELHRVGVTYNFNNFVDEFFQYKHENWLGKVTSPADIDEARIAEDADLNAYPQTGEPNGAMSLPLQTATGKWHVKLYNGKKYMVTPQGRLFWTFGLTGIHDWMTTAVENRSEMFDSLPSTSGPNGDLYIDIQTAQGTPTTAYYAVRHNLRHKFGQTYYPQWRDWARRRLASWGFNTVGAWSHQDIANGDRPYVYLLRTTDFPTHIVTPLIAWGPPPDPYAPDFQSWMTTQFTNELAVHNTRPNFIGCYVDNELSWGDGNSTSAINRYSIAVGVLQSPRNQPAKLELIRQVQRKYRTVRNLNRAWRTNFATFDQMNNVYTISQNSQITGSMRTDFALFIRSFASAYFTKVRAALTASGMQGVYFGCRFFHRTPEVIMAAAPSIDAYSFNDYSLPTDFNWSYYNSLPKPVVISEWSCPVNDEGTLGFHNMTYAQRQAAITSMLDTVVRQPNVIGLHWFEMYDQPVTNRGFDFENIGYGLVDVTDTPHPESVSAVREFSANLYSRRTQ